MKLIDVLPARPVSLIMERTFYPESLNDELTEREIQDGMLFGYCAWDGEKLTSLDGDNYSVNRQIEKFEWEEDGSLTYWTRYEWTGGEKNDDQKGTG